MDNDKTRIHFVPAYLANPRDPITIHLVGAGGSGSQMLSALARINYALLKLERQTLDVTVFDPDTVEEPNIGRQLFSVSELGLNKAEALVSRFNRNFGTEWKAEPEKHHLDSFHGKPNIIISCTDSAKSRIALGKYLKTIKDTPSLTHQPDEYQWMYWLDLGNLQTTGQAILGSNVISQPGSKKYVTVDNLPLITEEHKLSAKMDRGDAPSCSMAEALRKQDLFINSTLVQGAGSLLWNLLTKGYTTIRGFYLNLESLTMMPLQI